MPATFLPHQMGADAVVEVDRQINHAVCIGMAASC
jgi:hypothetical protein